MRFLFIYLSPKLSRWDTETWVREALTTKRRFIASSGKFRGNFAYCDPTKWMSSQGQ